MGLNDLFVAVTFGVLITFAYIGAIHVAASVLPERSRKAGAK